MVSTDKVFECARLLLIEPGRTSPNDISAHTLRLADLGKHYRGRLFVVVHVTDKTPPPSEMTLTAIRSFIRDHVCRVADLYIVLEVGGFRAAVMRSVAAGLVMMAPAGYSITIRKSLTGVLAELAPALPIPPEELAAQYASWHAKTSAPDEGPRPASSLLRAK